MRYVRSTALALLTTTILGAVAGTAWAPRVKLLPATGDTCWVDDVPGSFTGTFGLQSFTVQGGVSMAVGQVVGTCSTDDADVAVPGGTLVAVPFRVGASSCDQIDLDLGEASLPFGTAKMKLGALSLSLTPNPKTVRGLMCAFAAQAKNKPLTSLVAELNKIFERLA